MKRIISLILSCALLAGLAAGIPVFADGTASVYSDDYTVYKNSSVTIYVQARDFSSVSSLDLYIYYPDVFSLTGYNVQGLLSGASVSCNASAAGEIALSAISLDGISGSGTLISFTLSASSVEAGGYSCSVVPGDAYDTQLQPVSISGGSFGISVKEYVYQKSSDFYAGASDVSAKCGDTVTCDLYVRNSNGVSSGDLDVSYDPDVLTLESVYLSSAFTGANGAICSVNASAPGYAKISFASLSEVSVYYNKVLTATFTVAADDDLTSEVVMSAANLYDGEFNPIKATGVPATTRVIIEKMPIVVQKPMIYISDMNTTGDNFSVSVFAEADTALAAGDFIVGYDKDVMRCVAVTSASESCIVIGNPSFSDGKAKFSFVCQGGISADTEIARLEFEIVGSIISDTDIAVSLTGSGLVDADYNAVNADCVGGTVTIAAVHNYVAIVTAPTCTEAGYTTYTCSHCGDSYVVAGQAALGHIWGKWTVKKEPTFYSVGEEMRVCANDSSHIEIREIPRYLKGDLDFDGEITVSDALLVLRIAAGLAVQTELVLAVADTDRDDRLTVADALQVLRRSVGLITAEAWNRE